MRRRLKKYETVKGRSRLVISHREKGAKKEPLRRTKRSGTQMVNSGVCSAFTAGTVVRNRSGTSSLTRLNASTARIKFSIDFALLRAERRALERCEMPDAAHASRSLLRALVVWRSIASVTAAGDGGSEAESARRPGVCAGTGDGDTAEVLLRSTESVSSL